MNRSEKAAWLSTALLPLVAITVLAVAPFWWAVVVWTLIPVTILSLSLVVLRDDLSPPRKLSSGAGWGYTGGPDLSNGTVEAGTADPCG